MRVSFDSDWRLLRTGFLGTLAALCGFSSCCNDSCCDFGRPPVLCYKSQYVIDYNDCFEEFPIGRDAQCLEPLRKEPLTDDMFNPFGPVDPNYTLARGDILEISVFGEEETTVENAMIAPDGKLYYTVLEGIQAAGRPPEEVSQELEEKLNDLFVNPVVSVAPRESQALNFHVLGRVKQPGEFPLQGPVTLREAIAEAGGLLTPAAKDEDYVRRYLVPYYDLQNSFVVRNNRKLDVDFHKLIKEGDSSQNIYLRPGDYVYIAGAENKEVYLVGALNAPQRLTYIPNLTLLSALSTAGGWPTPNPYSPELGNVLVIRGGLECPRVCCVDMNKILCGQALDVHLEPGDIVYASPKHFRFAREMVLFAIGAFVEAFVSGAGEHYTRIHWFNAEEEINGGGNAD